MDCRVNILKAAFHHQRGEGFDFPMYKGRTKYGYGFNFYCLNVAPSMVQVGAMCFAASGGLPNLWC